MSERRGQIGRVAVAVVIACAAAHLRTPSVAAAATIRLVNRDGQNEGFNDPTPAAPVGGNGGTTLGEQRRIAFRYAIDQWAAQLDSPVEIRVGATFDPLDCNASTVTLGMAGPVSVFSDFAGAPLPDTFYPSALADRLAGMDLADDEDDIEAVFNSRFGTTCAFPAGWYYGLDGAPPGDDSDMVTVVLHELGHGLGFLTLVDVETGQRFEGLDDVFMGFLVDDRSGRRFTEMSNAERRAAMVASGHLKWDGAEVVAASDRVDAGADASGRVEMYAPPEPLEGSSVSHWSEELLPNELMEPFLTQPVHSVGLAAELLVDLGWARSVDRICVADCNGDRRVAIDELISSVRISLGELALSSCPAVDADGSGTVAVDELLDAVARALDGCGSTP